MNKECRRLKLEIPVSEIKQQLNYANTVGSDIFDVFAPTVPDVSGIISEYFTIQTKLSMLLDFIFQAKAWCDTLLPDNFCNKKSGETQNNNKNDENKEEI